MLALDIETTGLLEQTPFPEITCACLFDGSREYCLPFFSMPREIRDRNVAQLLHLLDGADCLVGYNAVLFDLEFIKRTFSITPQRMGAWVRKTIDPYTYLKYCLNSTSSLSNLLAINKLPSKTGSGTEAISMALEGRMEELLHYCLMDAKLVHQLCCLPLIALGNLSALRIHRPSGKWLMQLEEEADGTAAKSKGLGYISSIRRMRGAKPCLPTVAGIPFKTVVMAQILSPVPPINPELLDWITLE